MEHRCVLCNDAISEEDLSASIDYHLWDEFPGSFWKDKYDENGQPVPPESADIRVVLSTIPLRTEENSVVEWVHWPCEWAFGSGYTPDALMEMIVNNIRRV